MKKIGFILLSMILIGGGIVTALYFGYLRFNYPSTDEFPIQGIDVSHHQHTINWKEIKEQNVKFAFIKATEGGDFSDKRFLENWKEAQQNGIDVGAYHFFTFCRNPEEQAQHFINIVPKLQNTLPPVIDLEFGGNCQLTKSKNELLNDIKFFENRIAEYYDKKPILYVTQEFYDRYLLNEFPENPIWIRDIYQKPTLKDGRNWIFWQYGNRGHLKGIDTYVDLNVFNGNEMDYQKLMKK